jgi:hypothetical protein
MFWLIVVGVVAFSWGFAAGSTHEQYKPIKKPITMVQTFHNPNMPDRMTDKQRARLAR